MQWTVAVCGIHQPIWAKHANDRPINYCSPSAELLLSPVALLKINLTAWYVLWPDGSHTPQLVSQVSLMTFYAKLAVLLHQLCWGPLCRVLLHFITGEIAMVITTLCIFSSVIDKFLSRPLFAFLVYRLRWTRMHVYYYCQPPRLVVFRKKIFTERLSRFLHGCPL